MKEELDHAYAVIRWLWEGRGPSEAPLSSDQRQEVFDKVYAVKQTNTDREDEK